LGCVQKIISLFEFQLRCCNCGHSSDTYEPLIDLSLEIEDVDTLPRALESFTKVEKIEDSGTRFICEKCKEEVLMEKQFMLDQAPSVAAFHLKRFKTDGSFVEKVDKHVEFPLELDLQPYTTVCRNNNVSCSLSIS
jgi:ubiquitin carboxyl-terminal hydrolase 36/42